MPRFVLFPLRISRPQSGGLLDIHEMYSILDEWSGRVSETGLLADRTGADFLFTLSLARRRLRQSLKIHSFYLLFLAGPIGTSSTRPPAQTFINN